MKASFGLPDNMFYNRALNIYHKGGSM